MITKFVRFVEEWEINASEETFRLERVNDNSPFDVNFLNSLILEYTNRKPFPYTMIDPQEYSTLLETHSMTKGFLMMHGASFARGSEFVDKDWGMWETVEKIWDVGQCEVPHDHMPHNDAHTIAWEFQKLAAISRGEIEMKTTRCDPKPDDVVSNPEAPKKRRVEDRTTDEMKDGVTGEMKSAIKAMEEEMRKRVGLTGSLKIVLSDDTTFDTALDRIPFSRLTGELKNESGVWRIELLPIGPKAHFVWFLRGGAGSVQGPLYEQSSY